MGMKLPFPKFLANTPITVYKTELGEDGEEETTVVKGVMLTSVSTDTISMTLSILSRKALLIDIIIVIGIYINNQIILIISLRIIIQ